MPQESQGSHTARMGQIPRGSQGSHTAEWGLLAVQEALGAFEVVRLRGVHTQGVWGQPDQRSNSRALSD